MRKFLKILAYIGIHILTILYGYGLSLIYSSPILCVIVTVMSLLPKGVPDYFKHKFFLVYLLFCVPLGITFAAIVIFKSFRESYEAKKFAPTREQIKESLEKLNKKEKK